MRTDFLHSEKIRLSCFEILLRVTMLHFFQQESKFKLLTPQLCRAEKYKEACNSKIDMKFINTTCN